MEVRSAAFLKSSAHPKECPPADLPEYAFIGRSNVGKSSLINCLVGRSALAKTSSTPGKTQLINHFAVNAGSEDAWYLVDLPGFGYAKTARTLRVKWQRTSEQYLSSRTSLMCVMMLVDARHPPQRADLDFMAWMGETGLPFALIFTKVDKLNKTERAAFRATYEAEMLQEWNSMPPTFITSAETGEGRTELLDFIAEVNERG
jgi:GTP-binding protein